MNSISIWQKILRGLTIVMMGLTAFLTLASGAGTICVALAAERFGESMAPLIPYKWLYLIFVTLTLVIGGMGVRAVILLMRGRKGSVRFTLLTLLAGILIGVIHILVSRALRGKSMPTDPVVYLTIITLLIFLILRLPRLREKIEFEQAEVDSPTNFFSAAIILWMCGILTLSIPVWAGPSHTFEAGGINWANAWAVSMNSLGILLCLAGFAILLEIKIHLLQRSARFTSKRELTLS